MDKRELLEHLTKARAELLASIEGLSEAETTTLPVAGEWTIREILAHISGWAAWDLAGIRSILAGQRPDFSAIQDVDTFNARLVVERSSWSLAQILAEMRDTQAAMQELLAQMPDEDLFGIGPFQGPYWDNLAGWLQVAWEHEEEHTAQIRAWRATPSPGLHLRDDPIPWLLEEEENPSVRYLTLTDLLDRSEDDPQVMEARAAIPDSKDVQAIFARQDPAGWWDTPERATGIKRASGQLLILSRLGVPPDERTRRGCEFVLSKPWLPTRRPVCIVPCYTANCLRFLTHFGYGDDPRVDEGWRAMIERLERDDGLICWYQKQRPCHWLAVKALWAFTAAPEGWDVRAAIACTAEALLSHDFDFEGEEARWLRFGFPWYFQSDLLDALEALAACGYAGDPRFRTLAQHVVNKQQDDGRWLKEGGSTAVRIERKGQPSRWITLKALRVLKKMKEANDG